MKNQPQDMSEKEMDLHDDISKNLYEKNYDKALEISIKAKEDFPHQIFFYIAHSIANSQKGNFDNALEILMDALKLFPNDYELFFQIAKIYEDKNEYSKAEKYFLKSYKATPEDNHEAKSECMNDLGVIKYNQGKEKQAAKFWEKALKINPDNNKAKQNLYLLDEEDDDFEIGVSDSYERDFELFQYVQQNIYLKDHNRKKFKTEEEEKRINLYILTEWTNRIAGQINILESLNEDQKAQWFNSVQIDFYGPVPDIVVPEIDDPLYKEMSRKLSFLPSNAITYLMLVFPFLEAVGISVENFENIISENEIPEDDKEKYKWGYEIGKGVFKLSDSKSQMEFQNEFENIIKISTEKISKKDSKKLLMKTLKGMLDMELPPGLK